MTRSMLNRIDNQVAGHQDSSSAAIKPKAPQVHALPTKDILKGLKLPDDSIKNLFSKQGKKKTFFSNLDYLSPARKNLALVGWAGIYGGLGASIILSMFRGIKKGFSEPISNWVTLIGTIIQEVADYKNSLVRKLFKLLSLRGPALARRAAARDVVIQS